MPLTVGRRDGVARSFLVVWASVAVLAAATASESRGQEALLAATIAAGTPEEPAPLAAHPLLEANCFDCHGFGAAEGELALDELLAAGDTAAARDQWQKVWKMVRQGFMPPPDYLTLTRDERRQLTRWVEQAPLGIDLANPDPGRVTMRRLNRMEYEYTVTDLFGVELVKAGRFSSDSNSPEMRLRDLLPPDDTAHGFDNIGDFQTISPALLEKYFELAEFIVGNVIVVEGPWYPTRQLSRSDLDVERSDDTKRADHVATFEVTRAGRYRIDVGFNVGGWQEYGGAYDFRFSVDGEEVDADQFDVGGEEFHDYSHQLMLEEGEHSIVLATTAVKPDSEGDLQYLELGPKIEIVGPIVEGEATYPESHQRIFFDGEAPADPAAQREYAYVILERMAARAFRRPADADTLERLADLAMADDDFERGISHALTAILTSPRFLFRTELQPQPDDPEVRYELDDYSLASRLSYLLWLSMPDDELMELAAAGTLSEHLPEQLRRMLADPKSDRFFEDFVGQWLRTRNVLMTPISRRDDEIDPVRGPMKRETEMLFEYIARNDRDLLELITADYTFVDRCLARLYGLPSVQGGGMQRVELPPESHRGGILGHGSFLTATSNPNGTSPVKRGLFVLENLLATQPPAPPAAVPSLEEAEAEGRELRTVREKLEVHRADAACAACHAHFDPIGIALENFDNIGMWREDERGAPIDPTTEMITGEQLAGIADLRSYIAANEDRFYRCVTEKLMTYALGRGLEPYDAVTVDEITDRLIAEGGQFSTLLLAVVESPAFQTRRGDDAIERQAEGLDVPDIPPPEERQPRRRRRFNRPFQFNGQDDGEGPRRRRGNRAEAENDRENAAPAAEASRRDEANDESDASGENEADDD